MIPVRFNEFERYDITQDAEVLLLTATTPKGCYHAEIVKDGFIKIRENKAKFRKRAIDAITSGRMPGKVELG